MKRLKGLLLIGFVATLSFGATAALYLHHERSTQATVEADCQNREICLDKQNLAPLGRFNDGTLYHVVSQEKPNVNLTGTLAVTGAATFSNNVTLSARSPSTVLWTNGSSQVTTNTLTGTGTVLALQTSPTFVTPTLGIFSATSGTISGNLTQTGRINVNGAVDNASYNINIATGSIALSGSLPFIDLYSTGVPGDANRENLGIFSTAGVSHTIQAGIAGTGQYRDILIKNNGATQLTIKATGGVQFNGALVSGGTSAGYDEGTFTASLSGCSACSNGALSGGTCQVTAKYTRTGKQVTVLLPAVNGASSTGAYTITGMPASIQPATSAYVSIPYMQDQGQLTWGFMNCSGSTFSLGYFTAYNSTVTGSLNSGLKGFPFPITFSYILN